jgi:hypothetical protein
MAEWLTLPIGNSQSDVNIRWDQVGAVESNTDNSSTVHLIGGKSFMVSISAAQVMDKAGE